MPQAHGGTGTGQGYRLEADGAFVIEDYNRRPPFSDFFPGIAGPWGVPMWAFFVNRGQGIASFGIEGKDKAILEFQPANKAYRLAPLQGFRTFVKASRGGGAPVFWEPFQDPEPGMGGFQRMRITPHDLTMEDHHPEWGLTVRVEYFTLPGESFPALVRRVSLINTGPRSLPLELLDGLPVITPYGIKDWLAKNMSQTVEAWVTVRNLEAGVPFYHLNVEVSDTPDVRFIREGHFFLSFLRERDGVRRARAVAEAACVFGPALDFRRPRAFLEARRFRLPEHQQTSNRSPAAMAFHRLTLAPGKERVVTSLYGHAASLGALKAIARRVEKAGYIEAKAAENRDLIDSIRHRAFTHTASPELNLYTQATFLDNVLRGGLPISLPTARGAATFNVYSRKHGDLERDYNNFVISPTPLSQGNGNYRDVNQNRRNDVWFHPEAGDGALIDFLNLIQADGYNPLVVRGTVFIVQDQEAADQILRSRVRGDAGILRSLLMEGFQPGELLARARASGIAFKGGEARFLREILAVCGRKMEAVHAEGFWTDHWTYNLDLLERYLGLFPEDLPDLLLKRRVFTFFHNDHYVLPRASRYLLTERGVRQYQSVRDGTKEIHAARGGHLLRTRGGAGEVHTTTLIGKLLCLAANKAATFDPSGVGIEMEADKPNWYDALNGLPGLLGSSLCETLELRRLCLFLLDGLDAASASTEDRITVFRELAVFVRDLTRVLREEVDPTSYWHNANDVKERYRASVRHGIDGAEEALSVGEVRDFLTRILHRTCIAEERAADERGLTATYFYHEVLDYAPLEKRDDGHRYVLPVSFRRRTLPLFLEGFVHALRVNRDREAAVGIHRRLRRSALFDRGLEMYKVNADLTRVTTEIGRTRIFPRGWLENESIWLHMEYKYLLELLRCGLDEAFFETFDKVLIPFQPPERYGRSVLENSSFLVSSVHEDAGLHGRGFVARLSGSTAEFLHIWLLMMAGRRPFFLDDRGRLGLRLHPILPGRLFTDRETVVTFKEGDRWRRIDLPAGVCAFRFLDRTLIVYHNPARRDTFGRRGVRPRVYVMEFFGKRRVEHLETETLPEARARAVREGRVRRIDVHLA